MTSTRYDRVWDPKEADRHGRLDFVHTRVKFNKREPSYNILHSRGYKIPGFYQDVCDTSPTDCSDWTKVDKDRFRAAVFEKHENMKQVSEMIGKPIGECITYYLVKFKTTKSFKSLKRSMKRKANLSESSTAALVCTVCSKGGMLIACDTCEEHFHLDCTSPPLKSIPDGTWNCSDCKRGTRSMISSKSCDSILSLSCDMGSNATKRSANTSMSGVGDNPLSPSSQNVHLCPAETLHSKMPKLDGVNMQNIDPVMGPMYEETGSLPEQLRDGSGRKTIETNEGTVAISTTMTIVPV